MSPTALDTYAKLQGGYVAAMMLEEDIADQLSGTGETYFDWLSAQHRKLARALALRADTHRIRHLTEVGR